MKEIRADVSMLIPTVAEILANEGDYDLIGRLVSSYSMGLHVPHIEIVRHPLKDKYLISQGHKRAYAAYLAGIRPAAYLLETTEDGLIPRAGQGFGGEYPLEEYAAYLAEEAESLFGIGIDSIRFFDKDL